MVESFRESLREWLEHTMRADIYVTSPGPGSDRPERRLDEEVVAALLRVPGVADYGMSRAATVNSSSGPISLDALQPARLSFDSLQLAPDSSPHAWEDFRRGALVISEPLAWRLQLHSGDRLVLSTDSGPRPFPIGGIYREYGNDRGNILMSLATYRAHWHDSGISSLGLYLAPGARQAQVMADLRAAAQGRQALMMVSNADIRTLSMNIFDRTFVITRVLNWLAAGVAALGLISSLLAWELERSRELAIVRALGLTPRAAAVLVEGQTAFMGIAALLAAVPAGLLTALVLSEVINRRAFGWRIDLHVHPDQFVSALMVSITAALIAGLYPAWRAARTPIAREVREE
jgi:putative ABC transport system permease protein